MKWFRLGALAALVIVAVLGARPAAAQTSSAACPGSSGTQQYPPQNCSVAADKTHVRPGESITLTGQCPSGATSVTFRLVPGSLDLGSTTPASNGSYSRSVTIPSGTAPGDYEIQARCEGVQGAGVVRSVALTVLPASSANPSPTGATQDPGTLPRTGSDTAPVLALIAIVLVIVGTVTVLAARRKRPAA